MGGKSRKEREEEKLQRRKEEKAGVEEKKKKRHRLRVRNTEKNSYIYTGRFVVVISFLGF